MGEAIIRHEGGIRQLLRGAWVSAETIPRAFQLHLHDRNQARGVKRQQRGVNIKKRKENMIATCLKVEAPF